MNDQEPRPPLNYEPLRPNDQPNWLVTMFACTAGMAFGAGVVAFVNVPIFMLAADGPGHHRLSAITLPIGLIFFSIAAILFYAFRRYMKSKYHRGATRSFVAGFLIGAAVMCLCEGACFVSVVRSIEE